MNAFDAVIILTAVSAALGGLRLGFIARVTSWLGMAAGFVLAATALPTVVEYFESMGSNSLLLVTAGLLIGGAFVGQALGLVVGARLHLALPADGPGRVLDRGAGSLAGAVGVLVAVWMMLPIMADVAGWPARQARTSAVAELLDALAPHPPDTVQALRRLIGDQQFPRVFAGLDSSPKAGPPPASSGLSKQLIARVTQSTVKIEGVACRRIQEGSGFVIAPGVVVTNAHVVAGEDSTELLTPDGDRVDATVTMFDSNRDLAVLRAPGLGSPRLKIGDAEPGGRGAVFGYPGGGPLRVSPFGINREVTADGYDLYDRHRTNRQVFILAARLHPGDSGAALVNKRGAVVGVAFAIAPDRPKTAYALTTEELHAALAQDHGQQVDTGPCLR